MKYMNLPREVQVAVTKVNPEWIFFGSVGVLGNFHFGSVLRRTFLSEGVLVKISKIETFGGHKL